MNSFIKLQLLIGDCAKKIKTLISSLFNKINWLYVRLFLLMVVLIFQFLPVSRVDRNSVSEWVIVPTVFFFSIIGLQFVIGIQAFNPFSAKVWYRPSWYRNPFTFRQPLQFFHFGGWLMLVNSVQYLINSIGGFEQSQILAATNIAFGSGILIGVYLSTLLFRRKFAHA